MDPVTIAAGINLLMGLIDRAGILTALLAKAQAEGRDITAAEFAPLVAADDLAREQLAAAIAHAKTEGR